MTGNWKDIVTDCVNSRFQPKVLLYEKFDEIDREEDYCKQADKQLFSFKSYEIQELLEQANMADRMFEGEGFSQEEIAQQIQMMNEIQKEHADKPVREEKELQTPDPRATAPGTEDMWEAKKN